MEKCLDVGVNKESKLVKIRIRNGIIKSNFSLTKDETLRLINDLKIGIDMVSD